MQQYLTNNIYQSFLKRIGGDWFTPFNKNKFMTCGEFTLCADLHEIGVLERKREDGLFKFKVNGIHIPK